MAGNNTISTSETRIEALNIQSSAYGVTIPLVYGSNRIAGNMIWYGDFKSTPHTQTTSSGKGGGVQQSNTTYTYSASVIMGICEGTITGIPTVWKGKQSYTDGSTTGLAQLGLSSATGAVGQSTWSYLTSNYPSQAIGYSGLSYVYAQNYQLGSDTSIVNHSFEVRGKLYGSVSGSPDTDTASAVYDALTSLRYGSGFPTAKISTSVWSTYCLAAGLLTSPALETQMKGGDLVTAACAITNTAPIWSGGVLKFVPYGDTAMTANGATYTPNVTPIYDLTDDDFIPSVGDSPIKVSRLSQSDVFNHVRVEFTNRANSYNVEVAEAKDSSAISLYGLRSADILQAHWICDLGVARTVAQLILQRKIYIRSKFEFTLPWTKVMLEPMDLVTLTDANLGFNKLVVRITEISENESGDLAVIAEDFPQGVAHAALYTSQSSAGFQPNYGASPGSVTAPVVFEAPGPLTATGLEVWIAVRGAGALWGGCHVWISVDGTNYKNVGTATSGMRYGMLTGPIAAGNLPVSLYDGTPTPQLVSGSTADAAALNSLCYIAGANPEYLAYATATLTGVRAYTLGGLVRGAYSSNGSTAHATTDAFVRCDSGIVKSGQMDKSYVGKTIHLKFTSFNVFGLAEESLASVTDYTYTVTGQWIASADVTVAGTTASWSGVASKPSNVAALSGTEPIQNSAISIASNGTLSGAGGGAVTIGGLGYAGDLNATYGATLGTNVGGQINSGNVATLVAGGAIQTAQIANAAITSALINNAAIQTAHIADAQITTAKIGSAQVDTLQIAGQAVTIPGSAFTAGAVTCTPSGNTTVQSLTFTSSGAPVNISASLTLNQTGASGASNAILYLYRNGSLLSTTYIAENYLSGSGTAQQFRGSVAISYTDTPGAISVTYSLVIFVNGLVSSASSNYTCLVALEVKR